MKLLSELSFLEFISHKIILLEWNPPLFFRLQEKFNYNHQRWSLYFVLAKYWVEGRALVDIWPVLFYLVHYKDDTIKDLAYSFWHVPLGDFYAVRSLIDQINSHPSS